MHVVVLDMAGLRFAWDADRSTVTVASALGEVLAVVPAAGASDPEAAAAALDAVLAGTRLTRLGWEWLPPGRTPTRSPGATRTRFRVALYNPFTCTVALDGLPDTVAFTGPAPLHLPAAGLPGEVDVARTALVVGDSTWTRQEGGLQATARALSAHQP